VRIPGFCVKSSSSSVNNVGYDVNVVTMVNKMTFYGVNVGTREMTYSLS
jgi:hypothetical protein